MIAVIPDTRHSRPTSIVLQAPVAGHRSTGSVPCVVAWGAIMSKMDEVIPQATQLPILNRIVELVVMGEHDPRWLQEKVGFKSQRNVHYYLEAARWARLIAEDGAIASTSLGRRYVATQFDPRVVLEGVRGRPLYEDVLRASNGKPPTPEIVEAVLRRWSFRYSQSTLVRRARDFCRLFGTVMKDAATPAPRELVISGCWCAANEMPTLDGSPLLWPPLALQPVGGLRPSASGVAARSPQL